MLKNPSDLITSIKMDLGVYGLTLPNHDIDKIFRDVLQVKTLATFSTYYPYVMKAPINISSLEPIPPITHYYSKFRLPEKIGGCRIIGVRQVDPGNMEAPYGMAFAPEFQLGEASTYESAMILHAMSHLNSALAPPLSHDFQTPNILTLYNTNVAYNTLTIHFELHHDENLSTIQNGLFEGFEKLYLLDMKRVLYGIIKPYTNLQTAVGSIDLKVDDWASAEDERKQLLEKWDQDYHLSDPYIIFS